MKSEELCTAIDASSLRYKGYYYDPGTGFYYLQSRYYDPKVGRFISPDSYVSTGQGFAGNNMFAYCNNNPVNLYDATGTLPKWLTNIGGGLLNFGEALVKSIELQAGLGFGIGGNISSNVTAEISRDTYVGVDDGVLVTGNQITMELSLFDVLGIGNTYNHLVEKDFKRVSTSANAHDGLFDMIHYPDTTLGSKIAIGPIEVNNEGDLLISIALSGHILFGGHASAAFNITEFWGRLVD